MLPDQDSDDGTRARAVDAQALTVWASFVAQSESGGSSDLEALCARYPSLAHSLRSLHGAWLGSTAHVRGAPDTLSVRPARGDDGGDGEAGAGQARACGARYSGHAELARGGMGAILRVWDGQLGRPLAMKVVLDARGSSGGSSKHSLARFLEEAQVTAQLDHPGVVPVHELGVDDEGRTYFTMKLVKGRDLAAIIRLLDGEQEGWSLTRILGVLLKVCDAVSYAHSKGVFHRDLKPANVMVGRFGEVYVMDWGLAKVAGRPDARERPERPLHAAHPTTEVGARRRGDGGERSSALETTDGAILGTPAYMAPEQANGRLAEVRERSDVYALGALLYEIVTRKRPYDEPGSTPGALAVLARVVQGPPTPIEELVRGVPSELVAICEKAMARAAEERYASAEALGDDLRAYLEGRVVRAHRTGALVELFKWVRRNRFASAAMAVALAAVIGGLSAVYVVSAAKARELEVANEGERKARARAEYQSYVANLAAASSSLRAGEQAEARRRLESCVPELRRFEWSYLERTSAGEMLRVLTGHAGAVFAAAYSPDGTRVLSGGLDATPRLWDLVSGASVALAGEHRQQVNAVAFSPDGRSFATAGGSPGVQRDFGVRLWDTGLQHGVRRVLSGHESQVNALAFAPGGAQLASAARGGSVRLWDLASGGSRELRGHLGEVRALAFRPGSPELASGDVDGLVLVWDAERGELLATLRGHEASVQSLAYSPDGTLLASGSGDRTIALWDARTRELRHRLVPAREGSGRVRSIAFGPTGRLLAAGGEDRFVRVWDVAARVEVAALAGHEREVFAVAFSPDGARLLSGSIDGSVREWETPLSDDFPVFAERGRAPFALSSDGARIASATSDGKLCVWDAAAGVPELVREPPRGKALCALAFDAEGSRLLIAVRGERAESGDLALCALGPGGETRALAVPAAQMLTAAMTRDGARVAASFSTTSGAPLRTSGELLVWESASSAEPRTLECGGGVVDALAFQPGGELLAGATIDGVVRLWDARTAELLATLPGRGDHDLAFSPDGATLVAGTREDGAPVPRWDVSERVALTPLPGHDQKVVAVAFSPDGARLATGSNDRTVRIFDAEGATQLVALRGLSTPPRTLAFDPAGERLLAATGTLIEGRVQGEVVVWDARPAPARAAARVRLDELRRAWQLVAPLSERAVTSARIERELVLLRPAEPLASTARLVARLVGRDAWAPLNAQAWGVVCRPGEPAEAYERALCEAEAAYELSPDQSTVLNTLGVALVRVGRFDEAIATLERGFEHSGLIDDLVFVALAERLRGDAAGLERALARLSEILAPDAPAPEHLGELLELMPEARARLSR